MTVDRIKKRFTLEHRRPVTKTGGMNNNVYPPELIDNTINNALRGGRL
jgi:hypothetical protein